MTAFTHMVSSFSFTDCSNSRFVSSSNSSSSASSQKVLSSSFDLSRCLMLFCSRATSTRAPFGELSSARRRQLLDECQLTSGKDLRLEPFERSKGDRLVVYWDERGHGGSRSLEIEHEEGGEEAIACKASRDVDGDDGQAIAASTSTATQSSSTTAPSSYTCSQGERECQN